MEDLNAVKAKIAKLLAKAQGTDNENEAAAFMAKVEEMLDEYQLEHWQITSHADPMGFDMLYEGTSSSPTWQRHLLGATAQYYGCKMVRRRGLWKLKKTGKGGSSDNFELDVIGRESSRVTVQLMYPFIVEQCRQAGRKLWNEGHGGTADQLTRRVANALVFRIYRLIDERERAPVTAVSTSKNARALVVVNEIKAFVDGQYGKLSSGIARARSTTHAATQAASGISIERQVRGEGQKRIGNG